jgi:23S rRNA pseudouridine2605 synthase
LKTERSLRLNAFLASSGLGSRRSVEELISAGKIRVNGEVIRDFSTRVNPTDEVICQGKKVLHRKFQYIALNKPPGFACTRDDPYIKKTIYDILPPHFQHLAYAGRLDIESEGLVVLSNDGQWLNSILHPRHEVKKEYLVVVTGHPTQAALKAARHGIRDKNEMLHVDSAHILKTTDKTSKLRVVLHTGKNREIRRIFKTLGHPVLELQRVSIGKLLLGNLRRGYWKELSPVEIQNFKSES